MKLFFPFRIRMALGLLMCIATSGEVVSKDDQGGRKILSEFVWVTLDGEQRQIRYSVFDNDGWIKDQNPVYSSKNNIATPFLSTSRSGDKILIWAESRSATRMVLMMQRGLIDRTTNRLNWSSPVLFSDKILFNTQPVVIAGEQGVMWVFWAGDTGTDSNIYQRYFDGTVWSKSILAHPMSEVPEYQPKAEKIPGGEIKLSWLSYDPSSLEFVTRERLIDSVNESSLTRQEEEKVRAQELAVVEAVPIPDYLPSHEMVRLHFPNNKYIQHKSLNNSE